MIELDAVERDDRAEMVELDVFLIKAGLGMNRDMCVIEQINQALPIVSAGQSPGLTHTPHYSELHHKYRTS